MYRFFTIILFITLSFSTINSQNKNTDSLKIILQKCKTDTSKVNLLIEIGNDFFYINNDSSIFYYKKALAISRNNNFKKGIYNSAFHLGDKYFENSYYLLSIKYINKALKYSNFKKDKETYLDALNILSISYLRRGNTGKAMKYGFKALDISKKYNLISHTLKALNNIGSIYDEIKDCKNAIKYYDKSLKLCIENNDSLGFSIYYTNTGVTYFNQKKYKKAIQQYKKSLEINYKLNDTFNQSINIENIADIYTVQKKYKEAEKLYKEAYLKSESINDIYGKASILSGLGKIYLYEKKYNKAISCFKESIKYANEIGEINISIISYKNLAETYSKINKYDNALSSYKQFKSLNDSILLVKNNMQIAELEAERKDLKLNLENKNLNEKLSTERKYNRFSIYAISILSGLLLLTLYLFFKLKKSRKEIQEKEEDFEAILDASNDVVIMTDYSGKVLWVNSVIKKMSGYEKHEILNKNVRDLYPSETLRFNLRKIQEILRTKIINSYETKLTHKFKKFLIPVEISGKIIKYKGKQVAVSTVKDISERKNAEKKIKEINRALAEQNRIYNLVANNINDFIWLLDLDLNPIYLSPSVKNFIGYTPEEAKLINIRDLHSTETLNKTKKRISHGIRLKGSDYKDTFIIDYIHKNGEIITAEVKVHTALDKNKNIYGLAGVSRDVTARTKAEQALKENIRNNKYLIENVSAGITINDRNNNFIMVNKAAKKIFGTRNLVGRNLGEFVNIDIYKALKSKTDRKKAGETDNYDIEITSETGIIKVINIRTVPNFSGTKITGTIAIFNDVTADRESVDKLMKSEENYRILFENNPISLWEEDYSEIKKLIDDKKREGISDFRRYIKDNPKFVDLCDSKYKITNINKATLKLFKVKTKDEIYKNPARFFSEKSKNIFKKLLIVLSENVKYFDAETIMLDANRKRINILINLFVFNNYKKVIVTMTDITHLKDIEKQYIKAKKQADQANVLKSQFLANMSHEIRTPMNAIIGFSDILNERIKDPSHKAMLERIVYSGNNLLNLINDILDVSKIEAGKLSIVKKPSNINILFKDIFMIFSDKINKKGLNFKLTIDKKIPKILIIDELRIKQILINLISNATKFTKKGGISVSIKCTNKNEKKLDLIITVSDTGIGIPKNQINKIFEIFKQVDGQSTREFGGTGLGLSITKNLTEMMDGNIFVKSNENGSEFTIELKNVRIYKNSKYKLDDFIMEENIPLKESSYNTHSQEQSIPKKQDSKYKILYADDSEINREVFKTMLELKKIKIIEAENGQEAINILKEEIPDIIILDIQMPILDGYQAAKLIRNKKEYNNIPILAFSANIETNDTEKINIIFDDYITKPITKEKLKNKVLSRLKKE